MYKKKNNSHMKFFILIYIVATLIIAHYAFGQTYIKGPALVENSTSTATAAGTTTLTKDSQTNQIFTGTTTQTIVLPNATTLPLYRYFEVKNQSTGIITVQTNGGGALTSVYPGTQKKILVTNIGSAAGTWSVTGINVADVTGVLPITNGGTNNSSAYTAGSVLFSDGTSVTQDNANFFFDNATDALSVLGKIGVGTSALPSTVRLRSIYNNSDLASATSAIRAEGTHTLTANNAVVFQGMTSQPTLNQGAFNATVSANSGGSINGYHTLVSNSGVSGTTTAAVGYFSDVRNTGAGVLTNAIGFNAIGALNSGGGTLTNWMGFYAGTSTAATNNYGFHSNLAAATGRWNFYANGTADNYFAGKLGIGNTAPQTALEISAAADPTLRLSEASSTTSYTELYDASAISTVLRKVSASGTSAIYLDPITTDGTSSAFVELFRATNTTGLKRLQMFKGDGTNNVESEFNIGTGTYSYINSSGQTLGVGTSSPNTNAALDVSSTTKAFMPPRMTTTQKNAISSPTAGMEVYDSTLNAMYVYNGSTWVTGLTNPMTTGGDIIYGGASGVPTRLANGTAGQYLVSAGGTSAPVWTTPTLPNIVRYTSGSGTYTPTTGTKYIVVEMVGGGGGGGGSGTADGTTGGNGGDTTFGTRTAGGGSGTVRLSSGAGGSTSGTGYTVIAVAEGASGNGGNINPTPANGTQLNAGGGGSSFFGGGGAGGSGGGGGGDARAYGSGGGGGGNDATSAERSGGGGGAGAYIKFMVSAPSAVSYSVGAAGSAGTAGASGRGGGNGAAGAIIITEYF